MVVASFFKKTSNIGTCFYPNLCLWCIFWQYPAELVELKNFIESSTKYNFCCGELLTNFSTTYQLDAVLNREIQNSWDQ